MTQPLASGWLAVERAKSTAARQLARRQRQPRQQQQQEAAGEAVGAASDADAHSLLFGASIADLGPVKFQVNRLFRVPRGRNFLRLRRANKEGRSAPAASGDPIRDAHPGVWFLARLGTTWHYLAHRKAVMT